jgi:putative selenate reductase
MKCVEVCPNRANTLVRVPAGFRDEFQIVHIDAFCNECGNCATFCPWEGRPYKDKLTVFASEEDFTDSTNPGFFLKGNEGTLRVGGRTGRLHVDGARNVTADFSGPRTPPDASSLAVVQAIVSDYRYLLGGDA